MRRFLLLFLLLSNQFVFSQTPKLGNEWIDFNKTYLKISINKDGVYRISSKHLTTYFPELLKENPLNFKLFNKGQELAIKIIGENDGVFNIEDSILFYAEKNKGELDSLVYLPNATRHNKHHSLFSEESAYFLYCANNRGKRIKAYTEALNSPIGNTHLETLVYAPNTQYSFNNSIGLLPQVQQSYFESGEGFSGEFRSLDSLATYSINTLNFDNLADYKVKLRLKLAGRSRVPHMIQLAIDNVIIEDSLLINSFGELEIEKELPKELLIDNNLKLKFSSLQKLEYDWFSITYLELEYPQILKEDLLSDKIIQPIRNQKVVLNSNTYFALNIYDVTNVSVFNDLTVGAFEYNLKQTETKVFLTKFINDPLKVERIKFKNLSKTANYIILRPESLAASADKYAAYRASSLGGRFEVLTLSPNDLYNQFTFGYRNPKAITRFAEEQYQKGVNKYLLLYGRGITFPDVLKSQGAQDLVPSFGYPASDNLLTAGFSKDLDSEVQTMATGRLNISSSIEAENYLNKVKEYESQNIAQDWKKNILHLSGGQNLGELSYLKDILNLVKPKAETKLYGANVIALAKQTDQEVEPVDISNYVNKGVGLISYAGHGSANILDFNFGYCSPPNSGYDNKGKYPIMYFNGCGVGNVFYRYNTLTTDWLLTPNKGAIAVFANSFWSYLYPTQAFLSVFYDKLFVNKETAGLRLGDIHREVNKELAVEKSNPLVLSNINQLILQGDPALRIFPVADPDFSLGANNVFVKSINTLNPIANADSLLLGVILKNNGGLPSTSKINTRLLIKGESDQSINFTVDKVFNLDTIYHKIKNSKGITELKYQVDPENTIIEYSESNNEATLILDKSLINTSNIFPENIIKDILAPVVSLMIDNKVLGKDRIVSKNPKMFLELIDDRSINSGDSSLIKILLVNLETNIKTEVPYKNLTWNKLTNNSVGITFQFQNLVAGNYILEISSQDNAGNKSKSPVKYSFQVIDKNLPSTMSVFPNPASDYIKGFLQINSSDYPKVILALLVNNKGQIIEEKRLNSSVGKNEFYFKNSKSLNSGVYFVNFQIVWNDGKTEQLTQKIIK
jgi:hypothetical protein